ncbi:MAG: hypothetical protein RR609_07080, partial [Aurantimicrobium sp.]
FQDIISHPELSQVFDIPKIFKHIALQLGAQNVDDFVRMPIQPTLMPTEQVAGEAQAGNLIPIGDITNALSGQG